MSGARYSIGIDLGTTHTALAFAPLEGGVTAEVRELPIPQSIAPGEVQDRPLLPSFLYLPSETELAPGSLALPWNESPTRVVGEFARTHGASVPMRLVSSAKSWLCHPDVDRRAPILPLDAPAEVQRVSPLDASFAYLEHLRDAWNHAHPDARFDEQEITITVPASFDPSARELTAEAATRVGTGELVLLEEPTAALYAFIATHQDRFRESLKVGDVILVVDVGGGTTDLSLIAVTERDGQLEPHRIAVGEHILLGGDNMDLALAALVQRKLEGEGHTLDAWQQRALAHGCRQAKERLLATDEAEAAIVVPSRGSKLVGGSIRTSLTRAEATQVLVEGFFPRAQVTAKPTSRARSALTTVGLPYAQDPAITRHLASFVSRHAYATKDLPGFEEHAQRQQRFLHPTAILFNGGVFKSDVFASRITEIVNEWLTVDSAPSVRVLEGVDLDRAVARGAAYYGLVRRGGGVRIRTGLAQSFYVGVEPAMPAIPGLEPPVHAVCVAPFGLEEGESAEPMPMELGLVVGEPVRFRFFASSTRRDDRVGTTLERFGEDELVELGAIEALLPADGRREGDVVPVRLESRVTEVGTLELAARPRSGGERWKVELEVRGDR